MTWETFGERPPLVIGHEPRNLERMGNGEFARIEGLLHFAHELQEAEAGIDVFFRAPNLLSERLDGIGLRLQLHECGIAACFAEFVNVGALHVHAVSVRSRIVAGMVSRFASCEAW